jgi:hypothetical protein
LLSAVLSPILLLFCICTMFTTWWIIYYPSVVL